MSWFSVAKYNLLSVTIKEPGTLQGASQTLYKDKSFLCFTHKGTVVQGA